MWFCRGYCFCVEVDEQDVELDVEEDDVEEDEEEDDELLFTPLFFLFHKFLNRPFPAVPLHLHTTHLADELLLLLLELELLLKLLLALDVELLLSLLDFF